MEQLYLTQMKQWQQWLRQNHDQSEGLWLIFYKKETGQLSLPYEAAVEEALCWGWIDSLIKKLDEERYLRKFTPRKDTSKWSAVNKKRVLRLIDANRMQAPGLAKVEAAQANGQWKQADQSQNHAMPTELVDALKNNSAAQANWEKLTGSEQKRYCGWIQAAKRKITRQKRTLEAIQCMEQGQKLGMK